MSHSIFTFQKRVTYSDCTLGNHVYYSRYLDYFEEARGEFFRAASAPLIELQEQDLIFPVLECRLHYASAARYDDVISIGVEISRLDRLRLEFHYEVVRDGQRLVSGDTMHIASTTQEKPKRMPQAIIEKLKPFLRDR